MRCIFSHQKEAYNQHTKFHCLRYLCCLGNNKCSCSKIVEIVLRFVDILHKQSTISAKYTTNEMVGSIGLRNKNKKNFGYRSQ